MSRDIKFRAYNKQYNVMGECTLILKLSETETEVDYIGNNNEPIKVDNRNIFLEQYTGFKSIYENDIVGLKFYDKNSKKLVLNRTGLVVFHKSAFCIKWDNKITPISSFTDSFIIDKIGNIHENKDMLNG